MHILLVYIHLYKYTSRDIYVKKIECMYYIDEIETMCLSLYINIFIYLQRNDKKNYNMYSKILTFVHIVCMWIASTATHLLACWLVGWLTGFAVIFYILFAIYSEISPSKFLCVCPWHTIYYKIYFNTKKKIMRRSDKTREEEEENEEETHHQRTTSE